MQPFVRPGRDSGFNQGTQEVIGGLQAEEWHDPMTYFSCCVANSVRDGVVGKQGGQLPGQGSGSGE